MTRAGGRRCGDAHPHAQTRSRHKHFVSRNSSWCTQYPTRRKAPAHQQQQQPNGRTAVSAGPARLPPLPPSPALSAPPHLFGAPPRPPPPAPALSTDLAHAARSHPGLPASLLAQLQRSAPAAALNLPANALGRSPGTPLKATTNSRPPQISPRARAQATSAQTQQHPTHPPAIPPAALASLSPEALAVLVGGSGPSSRAQPPASAPAAGGAAGVAAAAAAGQTHGTLVLRRAREAGQHLAGSAALALRPPSAHKQQQGQGQQGQHGKEDPNVVYVPPRCVAVWGVSLSGCGWA